MKSPSILLRFTLLLSTSCDNISSDRVDLTSKADDSLVLVEMVHARTNTMKKKDINAVMKQFSDDATFINSDGYFLANKGEITEFHKALSQTDSLTYYYVSGQVHIRFLDEKNALVYYPNKMDWYKLSNQKDTVERETRLLTLSAQKRNGTWLWVAVTNQKTIQYFDNLTEHKITDMNQFWNDSTQNK
jgi:uncharacterized protein (TIGR02246 family)